MTAMLGSWAPCSVVASARCAARPGTVQAAVQRQMAFKPSQAARVAFQSSRSSRRREREVRVWASWGADVQFSGATLAGSSAEAEGLHRLQLDIGSALAAGYTAPGQYLQAKLSEDGKAGFFAIASPPDVNNGGVVELLVKAAGGTAEQLCAAAPGADVLVSSVMGKGFPVDRIPPAAFPTVIIFATGSGISPIKALIESGALAAGERRDVRLYYGAHSPAHLAFAADIPAWEAEHGVKVIPVLSVDGQGYVQDVFRREAGISDWSGAAAVLCGQKEMALAVTELFTENGVAKESILSNF